MPDIIQLDRVCHRYADGEPDIFREVSFTLAKGEMVFLTGASGSGKSTLLKLIARLAKPTVGKIVVGGLDLATLKTRQVPAYRRQFGMIFQNFNLLPERTVFDNVAMPLIIRGYSGDDIGRRVRAALDAVGLRGKEKAFPATLSGGEQQRAGIARSVVAKPQLLLADEPTGNLDPDTSREIMELFMRFNEVGVSVLVATHALGLIRRLPYRIVQIHEGLLMEAGGPHGPQGTPHVTPKPAARGPAGRVAHQPSWFSRVGQDHSRAIATTLREIRSRPFGMLLTAFVIGITLALPAGLHTLLRNFENLSGGLQGSLRASLFLKDSVDADAGAALSLSLSKHPGVLEAHYLPRDKALDEFRRYSGFGDALNALKDNPLPAVIVVTPDSKAPKAEIDGLLKDLAALPEVDIAKLDRQWLERLYAIVDIVKRAVLMIAAMLALTVLVVIGNTVRLDVEARREEIVVLKLIGAGNAFIRRPFLYTGVWYGLAGAVMACLLVELAVIALNAPAQRLAGLYDSAAQLVGLSGQAVASVFLAGFLLGWIGAFWTVSRHLGRIEPD